MIVGGYKIISLSGLNDNKIIHTKRKNDQNNDYDQQDVSENTAQYPLNTRPCPSTLVRTIFKLIPLSGNIELPYTPPPFTGSRSR